jgi:ankyrin repeat protein
MAAATAGNTESVRVLLEAGADPNRKDAYNFTAFYTLKKQAIERLLN